METTLAHPYERELVIMAEVWAYFHISCEVRGVSHSVFTLLPDVALHQRVADVVPMTVESKLVEK